MQCNIYYIVCTYTCVRRHVIAIVFLHTVPQLHIFQDHNHTIKHAYSLAIPTRYLASHAVVPPQSFLSLGNPLHTIRCYTSTATLQVLGTLSQFLTTKHPILIHLETKICICIFLMLQIASSQLICIIQVSTHMQS